MYPILFQVWGINFYTYGFFAAIAVFLSYLVMENLSKHKKMSIANLFDRIMLIFVIGLFFARLSYFIVYRGQFSNWYEFFYIWNGGLISYGGIIGGLVGFVLNFKKNLRDWLDILAIAFLLCSSIWRVGGFFSGGNPGVASNWIFAINGQIPIVIIESFTTGIAFLFFANIYKKNKLISGITFLTIFAFYGIIRFGIDYFRDYHEDTLLKSGQLIGLVMFIISFIAIFVLLYYDKYKGKTNEKSIINRRKICPSTKKKIIS